VCGVNGRAELIRNAGILEHGTAVGTRSYIGLVLMLGTMSVFGPLGINMYLPALTSIGREFLSGTASVQYTVASFMFGLASGQLFWGPLSERMGRRPLILIGLSMFVTASLICAVAWSVDLLLVARLLQGFGACAGMVLARAIVSDNFEGAGAAIILSWQQLIMGLAPIFAPLIGGALLVTLGWRSIFWLLTVAAAILLIVLWMRLSESRSAETALHARSESSLRACWTILKVRPLLGHLLVGGFSAATLMTWYAGCSPLFQEDFGWSLKRSSAVIGLLGIAIVAATQINRQLLSRFTPRRIIDAALVVGMTVLTAILIMILLRGPAVHATGLILGVSTYGFIAANNQACALGLDRLRSGSLSALIGAGNYGIGALLAWIVAGLPTEHGSTMIAIMITELLMAWVALRTLARQIRSQ
jgi:DHA1 family bicyclomycin/chloramphenicol resistance-like MFS transporter